MAWPQTKVVFKREMMYLQLSCFRWIKENVPDWQHTVVCSPDEGGTRRAGILAEKLHLPMALIHKESINEEHIISGNVQDKKVGLLPLFNGSCPWLK